MRPFLAATLLLMAGVPLAASAESNLLKNADFELGVSYDWTQDTNTWFVWGSVIRTNWHSRSGANAAVIRGSWCGVTNGGLEQEVTVSEGKLYEAGFHSYWDDGFTATQREFEIEWRNAAGGVIRTETFVLGLVGNQAIWHSSGTYPLAAPAGATRAEIRFDFAGTTPYGAFYVDDAFLRERGTTNRLLANRGFEEVFIAGEQGDWSAGGVAGRVNWQARHGSWSAAIKGSWAGANWGTLSQRVSVRPGTNYAVRFAHYRDNGFAAGTRDLRIRWLNSTGSVITTSVFQIVAPAAESNWYDSGVLCATAAPGAVEAELRFDFTNIGYSGVYYVDDVFFDEHRTFFRCAGTNILDPGGTPFLIRGLVLSGWFFPEAYIFRITRGDHINTHSEMRRRFEQVLGNADDAALFWQTYTTNFFTEADMAMFASSGVNAIRIPFNFREFSPEDNPGAYVREGFEQMDRAIEWAKRHNIRIILDMHSCPGGQASEASGDSEYIYQVWNNGHWEEHSIACLWETNATYVARTGRTPESNRRRTADIWRTIAERYRNEPWIIGYELINEPHLPEPTILPDPTNVMRGAFMQISEAVREADPNHIVFVEGDWFAESVGGLMPAWESNMAIAVHRYWKETGFQDGVMQTFLNTRASNNVPIWLSESGENSNPWFYDIARLFESNHIGWTWWGWKKTETIATIYSVPIPASFWYVVSNLWSDTVDSNLFRQGLMDLAQAVTTTNCARRIGYLESLFNTNGLFNVRSVPYADHALPGVVYAADYDVGNREVAYSDETYWCTNYQSWTEWNEGGQYRNDGVDISDTTEGSGFKVSYIAAGEWLKYTMSFGFGGRYDLEVRYASPTDAGRIRFMLDETNNLTGDVVLPASGGWDTPYWRSVTLTNLPIPTSGFHTGKLVVVNGGFDLSSLAFRLTENGFADNDLDGMDDHWEVRHGGNLDPAADADGDGADALHEYYSDTDPTNAYSRFFIGMSADANEVYAEWSSTARVYSMQFRSNLMKGAWTDWRTNVAGNGAALNIMTSNQAVDLGYYRLTARIR